MASDPRIGVVELVGYAAIAQQLHASVIERPAHPALRDFGACGKRDKGKPSSHELGKIPRITVMQKGGR